MSDYTDSDIALMAKLVPELTDNAWSRQSGKPITEIGFDEEGEESE